MKLLLIVFMVSVSLSVGCYEEPGGALSNFPVPKGFPVIITPNSNPITNEKIELGRLLFYDTRLSKNNEISCGSCHIQKFAFADSVAVSKGVNGETGTRNSQGFANSAYLTSLFWDGRAKTLEAQHFSALTGKVEMFSSSEIVDKALNEDSTYIALFKKAFANDIKPNTDNAMKAIATWIRTVLSGDARYDQFKNGVSSVLNESEKRGMNLFFSDRTKCGECHSGFNFTDNQYHSIGLHTHYYDEGRKLVTLKDEDIGKFRTPSLRNIEVTAPYMNEGLYTTLEEVVEHYNRGGEPFRNKDSRIKPLSLTSTEKKDLINFLKTLTDSTFLHNPKFGKP